MLSINTPTVLTIASGEARHMPSCSLSIPFLAQSAFSLKSFFHKTIGPLSPSIFFDTPVVPLVTISHFPTLPLNIPVHNFHIRRNHLIHIKLVTPCPFLPSFILSTALPVVHKSRISFIFRLTAIVQLFFHDKI